MICRLCSSVKASFKFSNFRELSGFVMSLSDCWASLQGDTDKVGTVGAIASCVGVFPSVIRMSVSVSRLILRGGERNHPYPVR